MKNKISFISSIFILLIIFGFGTWSLDDQLQTIIKENNLHVEMDLPKLDPVKVELGRLLFFDKLLSGNKDVSCATCHHPTEGSADGLPLSIGVGGEGLGSTRKMGYDRDRIPRNAPDVFNRGAAEWHTMFWDNRVSGSVEEGFDTPADEKLPGGLENILAVQAMFPVTSREEMRGEIGDLDINGEQNELALISPASPQAIWHRIMLRVRQFPEYVALFQKVYPDVEEEDLGFQHAANAIAAFETAAFTFNDSPWDRYISGDHSAITEEVKRGALLFYGKANCASCHSGSLMTDQQIHNIGVPQLGPGKGNAEPLDVGRYLESGLKEDLFAFRTPPLKNAELTGPWMHNGAYTDLEDAVRHHLDPEQHLRNYDPSQLPEELRNTYQNQPELLERIIEKLDPTLKQVVVLEEKEFDDLMAFIRAQTDTGALEMDDIVPAEVPSGLPVRD